MTTAPVVSVIIPAYNAERFLQRTLISAGDQTCREIEIIVVNDGSTDGTREIAETAALKDTRIRLLNVSHAGVASARNIGIQEARAQYTAFLDADDLWHPSKLNRQIAALTSGDGSSAAGVFSLMRVIDTADRVIGTGILLAETGYTFARHLYARPVGNGSSLLVRREVALEVEGFDQACEAAEDLDFELRIAARYPLVAIRMFLVGYRAYPGNRSSDGRRMARGLLGVADRQIAAHPELPDWARRCIWASSLEYASSVLVDQGHRLLAAPRVLELLQTEPARGLRFISRMVRRRIARRLPFALSSTLHPAILPLFQDLPPDCNIGPNAPTMRRSDVRTMARLRALDDAIGTLNDADLVRAHSRRELDVGKS